MDWRISLTQGQMQLTLSYSVTAWTRVSSLAHVSDKISGLADVQYIILSFTIFDAISTFLPFLC